jgi:hypothetical protein
MILAVSKVVRLFATGVESEVMQLSAQIANSLAGVLLAIPMYLLGLTLFNRRVAVTAALLFQCLPEGSRIMADALTEGTYLLFLTTALLFAVRSMTRRSVIGFALAGLFGGCAYLTRPEGILVAVAGVAVLLGLQLSSKLRGSWPRVVTCSTALVCAFTLVISPYVAVIGHLTNKTTGRNILQTTFNHSPTTGGNTGPLIATVPFAVFGPESRELPLIERHLWCLGAIAEEVIKGYHYVAWFPALIGLFWFRQRLRDVPGAWVPLVLTALNVAVLWRVAYVEAYVSSRHSLTFIVCTIYWASAALWRAGDVVAELAQRFAPHRPRLASGTAWAVVMVTALCASGLPKCFPPLHRNRSGFHAAGVWLARNAAPEDHIVDPFSWVEFYSGQVMRQAHGKTPKAGAALYVVLGGTKNEHERLPLIPTAKELASHGKIVYQWPPHPVPFKAEDVVVYRVR